jgi:hypothetical protein
VVDSASRASQDDWYKMVGIDCPLARDQSLATSWLDNFSRGFQWGSNGEPPETTRGSEIKKQ